MKMRWLSLALAIALLVPAGVWSQGARKSAATSGGPQPKIEVPETSHDFGDVYKDGKFLHAFAVYNRGNADLVIEEVKPG